MIDNVDLLYEEQRLLMLYRYMIRKEYNINNHHRYENTNNLQNHMEMQHAIYLADSLLWINQYGFVWDSHGPISLGLEANLNKIDKKKNEVLEFYSYFDDNIYSNDTINKLKYYYELSKIKHLEKFIKLTYDILKEPKGIELLADLAYIGSKMLPGMKFESVNKELQQFRPIFNNNELNKFAFRCIEEFNLVEPIDYSKGKVKRIGR